MEGKLLLLSALIGYLFFFYLAVYRALFAPLSKLPGPRYALFTDWWLMYKEFTSQRREYIHELHKKYGPVVRVGPNEVCFISVAAVKEIYMSGGSGFDKTEFYTLFKQFSTRTMFSTLGKGDHSQKKRHIAGQYANTNIMRPEIIDGIQDRADAFVKKCSESKGESIDAYVYLHCYALDCASHFLFHPYGTHSIERKEDLEMMEELSYHNSLMKNLAQYRWPALVDILDKIIHPRPAPLANKYVLESSKKFDVGEQTLAHKLQHSKTAFQLIQIAAECMDHLAAGIDTTGDALCFLMYQLSLPSSYSTQDALAAELQASQSNSLDELPYLDAVVKEALRCFPPIPMSQPRYVPAGGRSIDGYFVPAGTIVSCQAWSVHQLNEDVFPEGEKFKPERWLNEKRVVDMNRLFFSFGAGARGCTGRHLGIAEMKTLLKEVYSRYRTRIAPDMNGRMTISDQVISSRPMDQTCRLTFEARN